tara:strand:- start:463 stop:1056 length:594 start_codon:yes stop_codon:yes gene_type:complete
MVFRFITLLFFLIILGCSGNDADKKDNSELYAKSQQVDAIIKRSGTKMDPDNPMALKDAENRLRTGGGLFGKKGLSFDMFEQGEKSGAVASVGLPINAILWRSSLQVINFMPISSADPFSGIIITDWYTSEENKGQRCKLNVFVKGVELKSSNLEVNSFCQEKDDGEWVNVAQNENDDLQIENAILNQAKKIKLASN